MKKFAGIVIATLFFLHLSGTSIYANEIYIVKSGDTLWQIAQINGTTTDNLIRLNNLKNDFLNIGQQLIVKESPPVKTDSPSTSATTEPTSTLPADTNNILVVQSGDNLWQIAHHNNVSVDSLMEINNLTSDALQVGQELIIPLEAVPAVAVQDIPVNPSRAGMPISGDRIIQAAAGYLGAPYRYGGSSPSGFDCSGFTSYVFNIFNIKLNRTAASQYSHGVAVAKEDLQIGDLVFFAGGGSIDHVGIYSGEGKFIHSSSPRSGGVIYSALSESYYAKSYVGARRVIN